ELTPSDGRLRRMGKVLITALGWLAVTGLVLIALAAITPANKYPMPITFLCAGAACLLLAGIPWALMPTRRNLKAAFLGLMGFAAGGALGFTLGGAVGD